MLLCIYMVFMFSSVCGEQILIYLYICFPLFFVEHECDFDFDFHLQCCPGDLVVELPYEPTRCALGHQQR